MSQKLLSIPTYSELKAKNQDSEKNKKMLLLRCVRKKIRIPKNYVHPLTKENP